MRTRRSLELQWVGLFRGLECLHANLVIFRGLEFLETELGIATSPDGIGSDQGAKELFTRARGIDLPMAYPAL